MSLILRAAHYAQQAHHGQTREGTGDPYIVHPGRVASRVSRLDEATEEMVAAAWLHDVVEDCGVTRDEIASLFGIGVCDIVIGMTNLKKDCGLSNRLRRKSDLDRIVAATRPVKLVKFCDRIDNVRDSDRASVGFRQSYIVKAQGFLDALRGTDEELEGELTAAIAHLRSITPTQEEEEKP